MTRRRLTCVLAVVVAGVAPLATAPSGAAEQVVVEFAFTGAPETWVVPDGVTEITATTCGAQGGDSATLINSDPGPSRAGGPGGCATSTLPVTPGEELTILVGGRGVGADLSDLSDPVTVAGVAQGGFNGGGAGGLAAAVAIGQDPAQCLDWAVVTAALGGGGGGASDIRRGGDALGDRVLVGGGGGGAGTDGLTVEVRDERCDAPSSPASANRAPTSFSSSQAGTGSLQITAPSSASFTGGEGSSFAPGGPGGPGGGEVGEDGDDGIPDTTAAHGEGGAGGTTAAGGAGGVGELPGGPGTPGAGGQGDGHSDLQVLTTGNPVVVFTGATASGGGGGGLFGGGGGGSGQVVAADDVGGSGGGGGGSGTGPAGTTYEVGVNTGDGSVLITYTLPEVAPDTTVPPAGPVPGRPTFAG